jgi:hypothetical protein
MYAYICTFSLFVHPLMDTSMILLWSLFLLWILLQWTREGRCPFKMLISFPLDIYLEVEMLAYIIILFWIDFLKNYLTFSHDFLIYNPTNSVKSFLFFTSSQILLSFIFLILILLACVQPCLIMVLPCISLRVTVSLWQDGSVIFNSIVF